MTDHKFTDEEVVKALEFCLQGDSCFGCCPYDDGDDDCTYCTSKLARDALDLINRQKAEIERLQDDRDGKIKSLAAAFNIAEAEERVEAYIRSQKSEVIKEFAERLKKQATSICSGHGMSSDVVYVEYINKIAEEMMEEET